MRVRFVHAVVMNQFEFRGIDLRLLLGLVAEPAGEEETPEDADASKDTERAAPSEERRGCAGAHDQQGPEKRG